MEAANVMIEQQRLLEDSRAFVSYIDTLTDEQFTYRPAEKWSVADVMQHLYLSARPVARLMAGPRDVFTQWGSPNSSARSYDTLVDDYQKVLATGMKAPAVFSPRPEDMLVDNQKIVERFQSVYQELIDTAGQWSEQELDQYAMQHPALGKLSVREMLHFTSLHTRHHLRLLLAN